MTASATHLFPGSSSRLGGRGGAWQGGAASGMHSTWPCWGESRGAWNPTFVGGRMMTQVLCKIMAQPHCLGAALEKRGLQTGAVSSSSRWPAWPSPKGRSSSGHQELPMPRLFWHQDAGQRERRVAILKGQAWVWGRGCPLRLATALPPPCGTLVSGLPGHWPIPGIRPTVAWPRRCVSASSVGSSIYRSRASFTSQASSLPRVLPGATDTQPPWEHSRLQAPYALRPCGTPLALAVGGT